jgi:hypothetical protein
MDYYSITTSDVEWRAAICLCGMSGCRGSFLHFATQDELQQVLNQNYGPLWRYASLLRACSSIPVSKEDLSVIDRHGLHKVALGENPPKWVLKYVAEILRFIEYERKALPCALLRKNEENAACGYSYSNADMDARCVMEQRVQSMICCLSMVMRIVTSEKQQTLQNSCPLVGHSPLQAISKVFQRLLPIAKCLEEYLLLPMQSQTPGLSSKKADIVNDTVIADSTEVKIDKVRKVVQEVRLLLTECPKGMAKLREVCLSIRKQLLEIELYSTPVARINQLTDILVLWAYTTNYSFAQEYENLTADPITVVARELGTAIPRSKVVSSFYDKSRRRNRETEVSEDIKIVPVENGSCDSKDENCDDSWAETTTESVDPPSPTGMETSVSKEDIPSLADNDSCITEEDIEPVSVAVSSVVEDGETRNEFAAASSGKRNFLLSPNEPVFMGSKVYPPMFCFWQVLYVVSPLFVVLFFAVPNS